MVIITLIKRILITTVVMIGAFVVRLLLFCRPGKRLELLRKKREYKKKS